MRRFEGRRAAERSGDPPSAEAVAVRLLARREHSAEELRRKLLAKGFEAEVVQAVLDKLGARRLVSDERYTGGFVRHHISRGQGPVRIRAELRQQGVAESVIRQGLDDAGVDWRVLAAQVRGRRFGARPPRSPAERAKQARFLQYRGFSAEHIRAAFVTGLDADSGLEDMDIDPDSLQDEAASPPGAPRPVDE